MKIKIALTTVLVALILSTRLLPHPPNFTAAAAVALFAGAILPRRLAITVPLAAMIISDLIIGLHPLVLVTWSSFILFTLLGGYLFGRVNPFRVVAGSFSASILFYLISNLGVWAEGRLYSRTLDGLAMSYWNGLPFLRYTVMGDLVFTVFLFGIYALVCYSTNLPLQKNPLEEAKI